MKRVVSISLGTSKRNKESEIELLGEKFVLERIGTDGDMPRFAQMFKDLDGKVDALGVGGADIDVALEEKKYTFREIKNLIQGATKTPVVDGGGLKHTLERETIFNLQNSGVVDFKQERVLLVSAVDRFGMAQALDKVCPDVIYGDILFGIGMKIPLTKYRQVKKLGKFILPIVTQLPFKWFYPTGEKQEHRAPKYPDVFATRTLICGDWHYIRRYSPDKMPGKTILTQTLRKADLDLLRGMQVRRAITTTPVIGGETFATNVMEGVIVALLGKPPAQISDQEYLDVLKRLDWKPNVIELDGVSEGTLQESKP